MYVKYCENKPKSEFIVAEYIDTVFGVSIPVLCPTGFIGEVTGLRQRKTLKVIKWKA